MANNRASLSLIAPGFTAATLFLVFEVVRIYIEQIPNPNMFGVLIFVLKH